MALDVINLQKFVADDDHGCRGPYDYSIMVTAGLERGEVGVRGGRGVAAGWHERAEVLRNPVRAAWPRILLKTGRPVEARFYPPDALVVAAHADDETLGCGATIARKVGAGAHLSILIATDGSGSPPHVTDRHALVQQRRAELLRATSHLDVPPGNIVNLGLPDGALAGAVRELAHQTAELLLDTRPAQLFTHSRWDPHPDHRSCWQAVMQALTTVKSRLPEFPCAVYEFPIWDWSLGPWPHRESGRVSKAAHLIADPVASLSHGRPWLSDAREFLAVKRDALREYHSQVDSWSGQPPSLSPEFIDGLTGPCEVFLRGRLPRRLSVGTRAGGR